MDDHGVILIELVDKEDATHIPKEIVRDG
ncbi:MAG: hypothetical protein ACI86M_001582, partial [Saprospiraceae bacterium]